LIIYKLKISYQGTRYEGWQVQPAPRKTVQGELNKALKKIFKSDDIYTLGSGRTDSGVHALGQVVKVIAPFFIEESSLKKALNSFLNLDIRVVDLSRSEDFHPTIDAISKTYNYVFYQGDSLPPFLESRVCLIKEGLDWKKMEDASRFFIGTHDFINFSTKGTPVKTTVREIFDISFEYGRADFFDFELCSSQVITVSFKGKGFLKQMVRLLVGALLESGKGKIDTKEIKEHLTCEAIDDKLGPVAPGHGLYLREVIY